MTNGGASPSEADLMRERRLQRNLKIVVGGLGALILVGLGAIIARVITLSVAPSGRSESLATGAAAPAGSALNVEIPKGARVVSVSLSGSRLALHHEGPDGPGVLIVDIETGRRVADVRPVEAVPRGRN
jgi:hypothetical protein